MPKEGMHRAVYHHKDPTYEAVVSRFRKEAEEARQRNRSMAAFRVFATVRAIIRKAGYELESEIVLKDNRGNIFRHGGGK